MNERLDKLAEEFLQKTRCGKLRWEQGTFLPLSDRVNESFLATLGEDNSVRFLVSRLQMGENIRITLTLQTSPQAKPTFVEVRNWPMRPDGSIDSEAVNRFWLYSDLFDAAKESTVNVDEEFGKVEELLRKIG